MRVSMFGLSLAAMFGFAASAHALIIIPTNQNGADTELREFEMNASALSPNVVATAQRGNGTELATRAIDEGVEENNSDRSSMMYMKFDISGLPNHNSDPGFWAAQNLFFRGYIRNTNVNNGRTLDTTRNGAPLPGDQWERVKFTIRGLEPGHVYADDQGGTTMRTDRSGNNYNSPNYKYNWDEGTGTVGTGITFVDAPGITPHCMVRGMCSTDGGNSATNIYQTLGVYDDFNSDTRVLGDWTWPIPKFSENGTDRFPVGMPMEYTDTNGALKQLVFDAQDAGRSNVTLILHLGVNTLSESFGGLFSGNDFLNFNYLFIPKEMNPLTNDNNWDPDGPGPLGGIGSPFSCNGGDGTMGTSTNCNGDGTPNGDNVLRTLGDNSMGAFSPQLIVRVPEPASIALMTIGALVIGAARRRK